MADNNAVTPTPENPIPDVDEIKPRIPSPAWSNEGGGGGGGSPLKPAKVTLLPNNSNLKVSDAFDNQCLAYYYPENGSIPPFVGANPFDTPPIPFSSWNTHMENGLRIVALQGFLIKTDSYEYAVEGDAEIRNDDGDYIYVTGDCTINVNPKESEE